MIFTSIWSKVASAMGVVIAALLAFIKFRSGKIEKLESKVKVSEKLDEVREAQKEAKKEILKDEAKEVKKKLKIKPTNTRRERIKRMRNNNTRT
jgi:hypothetical protein